LPPPTAMKGELKALDKRFQNRQQSITIYDRKMSFKRKSSIPLTIGTPKTGGRSGRSGRRGVFEQHITGVAAAAAGAGAAVMAGGPPADDPKHIFLYDKEFYLIKDGMTLKDYLRGFYLNEFRFYNQLVSIMFEDLSVLSQILTRRDLYLVNDEILGIYYSLANNQVPQTWFLNGFECNVNISFNTWFKYLLKKSKYMAELVSKGGLPPPVISMETLFHPAHLLLGLRRQYALENRISVARLKFYAKPLREVPLHQPVSSALYLGGIYLRGGSLQMPSTMLIDDHWNSAADVYELPAIKLEIFIEREGEDDGYEDSIPIFFGQAYQVYKNTKMKKETPSKKLIRCPLLFGHRKCDYGINFELYFAAKQSPSHWARKELVAYMHNHTE